MAKFNPYTIEKTPENERPFGAEISYVCAIPDWDRRGVRHTLIASAQFQDVTGVEEYRFVVDYPDRSPHSRVIDLPLYRLGVQKIRDAIEINLKETEFTIHPRMVEATAEMLESARKKILADLRV